MVTVNGAYTNNDVVNEVDISKLMVSSDEATSSSPKHRRSTKQVNPLDWGFPGHLTKEEVDVYVRLE